MLLKNRVRHITQMMKKAPPASPATQRAMSILHLFLAQKASWWIFLDLFFMSSEIELSCVVFLTVSSTFYSRCSTFSMFSFIISCSFCSYLLSSYFLSGSLLELKKVWMAKQIRIVVYRFSKRWLTCRTSLLRRYLLVWIFI
jgi:hypothetical protein